MPDQAKKAKAVNLTDTPDFSAGSTSVKKTAEPVVTTPPQPKVKKEVRRPLKPRDMKFVEAKVKNPDTPDYKAAMVATGTTDMNIASTQANRMLKNVTLRETLDQAMADMGYSIEGILEPVQDALVYEGETDRDTLEMRLKGHDRAVKLLTIIGGENKGDGAGTINFNIGNMFVKKGDA